MFPRCRLSIPVAALTGLALGCAPTASAAPAPGVCEHDPAAQKVSYTWPTSYVSSDLPIIQQVSGAIKVGRSTSNACGGATTGNTTRIEILGQPFGAFGNDHIVLSLHNPLLTTGGEEIRVEFVAPGTNVRVRVNGSTGDDHIVAGENGINFTADETVPDVDVTVSGAGRIQPGNMGCDVGSSTCSALNDAGTAGNDVLSTQGGSGTGGPAYQALTASGVLIGGQGNDTLRAADWSSVNGGPGNDVLVGPGTPDNNAAVRYDTAPGPVTVDLADTGQQDTGDGADTITGFDRAMGGRFADTLEGDGDENSLDGGSVHGTDVGDTLNGRGGDDSLSGGPGDDTLDGGPGDDNLSGSTGSDTMRGGDGDDSLTGDTGTDAGQNGNDTLEGGAGNDLLTPARGNNTVDGGPGTDTISFSYLTAGVTYDLAVETQDTGGGGVLTARNLENITTSYFSDTIYGDDKPNRVMGNFDASGTPKPANRDVIDLRGGDDYASVRTEQGARVLGGPGDDQLFGDDGPDELDGGSGADTIWAREGDDTLTAPAEGAKDTLRCEEGNDTVTSYDAGLDVLEDCEVGTPGTPRVPPAPAPDAPTPDAPAPLPPAPVPPAVTEPLMQPLAPEKLPSSLLDAPKSSTKTCLSRRSFTITLKQKQGVVYRRAVVTLKAGEKQIVRHLTPRTVRVKVKRKGKRKARTVKKTQVPVSLVGLPKGKFTVDIEVTAKDGAVLTGKRTYRTCEKKRLPPKKNKL